MQSHKTPTSVLTDRYGKFIHFGYQTETCYAESLIDDDGKYGKYRLFRNFSTVLYHARVHDLGS